MGADGLPGLEALLREAGHAPARTRRVRADEPGDDEAWRAALAGWVREGGFELLVVGRCWDAATLDALRAALPPGGRVVRLDAGHAAGLDDRFDAVLDAAGVLALAAGGAPAPAVHRQATSRELRTRPRAAAPGEAGGRPTISGPSQGCPFLLDVRVNPRFEGIPLDPAVDRTRGCAFCLDGRGGYVAAPEAETVASWLAQLRAVRAADPGAREILLTDERPHAHLAAFFRALAAEPALGPVELLVKSRVDWLRDDRAHLEEACRAAAGGRSTLHLYLVGFEAFDQATLDLFNKGVTVADNLAALAILRELERDHPGAFEFRRHRAHGFVAFHPWSTPEGLLQNARVMREARFHEVRAEAFRTRLRLYPGTPLHALAAAEGLLAGAHAPGRGDRAAEQGYQASVPWRFADPVLELVWRLAEGLHAARPELDDADLLELSTRWALRWPGLADAPQVAHLPLLQAIASWGSVEAVALVGAAAAGVDRELARLGADGKRACLKEGVPVADAAGLVEAYRAMGLAAEVLEHHGLDAAGNAHLPGDRLAVVAVAADEATLRAVLAWQRRGDVAAMGAVMGYPRCCAEAFAAQPGRGDNVENERWTQRRGAGEPLAPPLNRLAGLRLVSHHPCTPACFPSRLQAEAALSIVEACDPAAARRVRAALGRGVLFLDHRRAAAVAGRFEADELLVEAFEPHRGAEAAFGAEPPAALRVEPSGVRLRRRDGAAAFLAAARPLLAFPGEPLHPAALAALGGPAAPGPRWLELSPDPRRNDRPIGVAPSAGPPPALGELEAWLAEGRRRGLAWLALGGGEPTLRRDLPAIVRLARRLGYHRVVLRTNGLVLAGPGVADRLAQAGLTGAALALRGASAATHDARSRLPGAFDLLRRGVEAARDAGLSLEGELLVTRSGAAELPAMVALLAGLGVPRLRARLLLEAGGDAEADAEVVELAALRGPLAEALAAGVELSLPEVPACLLPPALRRAAARAVDGPGLRLPGGPGEVGGPAAGDPACVACGARHGCPGAPPALLAQPGAALRPLSG